MKSSLAIRFTAATCSVAITTAIFHAVVSIAEQRQADGSLRLAHTSLQTTGRPVPAVVALSSTPVAHGVDGEALATTTPR